MKSEPLARPLLSSLSSLQSRLLKPDVRLPRLRIDQERFGLKGVVLMKIWRSQRGSISARGNSVIQRLRMSVSPLLLKWKARAHFLKKALHV